MQTHHPIQRLALIGSVCVGKSTIADLLSNVLSLPHLYLDEIGEPYLEQLGFGHDTMHKRFHSEGFHLPYQQAAPAFASMVEQVLLAHTRGILDFGGGHSHYADRTLFLRVKTALAAVEHVIQLLPSPDLEHSVRILRARSMAERGWAWAVDGYDYIEHWVKDDCNHLLATHTVYTLEKTPEETCHEIVQHLNHPKP
jgi:hypothetical protein